MIKKSSDDAGRRLERPCIVMQISLLGSTEIDSISPKRKKKNQILSLSGYIAQHRSS